LKIPSRTSISTFEATETN